MPSICTVEFTRKAVSDDLVIDVIRDHLTELELKLLDEEEEETRKAAQFLTDSVVRQVRNRIHELFPSVLDEKKDSADHYQGPVDEKMESWLGKLRPPTESEFEEQASLDADKEPAAAFWRNMCLAGRKVWQELQQKTAADWILQDMGEESKSRLNQFQIHKSVQIEEVLLLSTSADNMGVNVPVDVMVAYIRPTGDKTFTSLSLRWQRDGQLVIGPSTFNEKAASLPDAERMAKLAGLEVEAEHNES